MEMVSSVPVARQVIMINKEANNELIKKLCVFSICLRMHLRTLNISWGSMPPDSPRVKDCRAAMFSTSANDIAPPDGKSYVRPCTHTYKVSQG